MDLRLLKWNNSRDCPKNFVYVYIFTIFIMTTGLILDINGIKTPATLNASVHQTQCLEFTIVL